MSAFDEYYTQDKKQEKPTVGPSSAFDAVYMKGEKAAPVKKPVSKAATLQKELLSGTKKREQTLKPFPTRGAISAAMPKDIAKPLSKPSDFSLDGINKTMGAAAVVAQRTPRGRIKNEAYQRVEQGQAAEALKQRKIGKLEKPTKQDAVTSLQSGTAGAIKSLSAGLYQPKWGEERAREQVAAATFVPATFLHTVLGGGVLGAAGKAVPAIGKGVEAARGIEKAIEKAPTLQRLAARAIQGAGAGAAYDAGYGATYEAGKEGPFNPERYAKGLKETMPYAIGGGALLQAGMPELAKGINSMAGKVKAWKAGRQIPPVAEEVIAEPPVKTETVSRKLHPDVKRTKVENKMVYRHADGTEFAGKGAFSKANEYAAKDVAYEAGPVATAQGRPQVEPEVLPVAEAPVKQAGAQPGGTGASVEAPQIIDEATPQQRVNEAMPGKTLPGSGVDAFGGKAEMPKATTSVPQQKPVKASDIVADLEKSFAPIRTGRFRERALGIYKNKPEVIRVKTANDLPVVAHEVGHHLQKILFADGATSGRGLIDKDIPLAFHDELAPMAYEGAKKRVVEGYAEFVRHYLTNPAEAMAKAPKFYRYFDEVLDAQPQIKATLQKAQDNIRMWVEQPSAAKVMSTISRNEPGYKRPVTGNKLYSDWVDNLRNLETAVKDITGGESISSSSNPFEEAWRGRGIAGKAETWLERGVTNDTGQVVSEGLKNILRPVAGKLDDFSSYAVSRHALDVIADGKKMPLPSKDYESVVANAPEEYEAVLRKLVDYQDNLLRELVDSGMMSAEAKAAMREKWPNHVPLYRVFDGKEAAKGVGKAMGNIASPVKRLKGSGRDIVDPIESIVGDTYRMLSLAQRNKVLLKLSDLADAYEGAGKLIEKVPAPMKPVTVSLDELLDAGSLPDDFENISKTIFRPSYSPSGKENIIAVWRNGKQEYYQLEPELYNTVMNTDAGTSNLVMDLLSAPASILRAGATLTPEFALRNPIRDISTAMINSEYGFTPLDFFRGVFNVLGKTDLYYQWKATGGSHAAFVSVDRNYLQNSLKRLQRTKPSEGVIDMLTHPIEALRALSEVTEEATRVGEFGKGIKWGKDGNADNILSAALDSRDVTLDFSRSGTAGKQVNRVVAFWNAAVQGLDKQVRVFKANPTRSITRSVAYITVPTIGLYLLNRNDERYRRLPDWEKDVFWMIPTKDYLVRIPRPHLLGHLFGTLPERILRHIDQNDPNAFDGFAENLLTSMAPGVLPTALVPLVDVMANKAFSGAPIVPEREKRLPKEYQYGTNTSELARGAGKLTGQSPRQIDYLIRGYTGGLGGYATQGVDKAIQAAGAGKQPQRAAPLMSDRPVIKAFLHNEWSSSVDLSRMYKTKERLEQKAAAVKLGGPSPTEAEQEKLKKLKYIDERMKDIRGFTRKIEANTTITPVDKRKYLYAFKKIDDDIAALAMKKSTPEQVNVLMERAAAIRDEVRSKYPE